MLQLSEGSMKRRERQFELYWYIIGQLFKRLLGVNELLICFFLWLEMEMKKKGKRGLRVFAILERFLNVDICFVLELEYCFLESYFVQCERKVEVYMCGQLESLMYR